VRVLFSVRNAAYVRHYEPVIRALAGRGHAIDLVVDGGEKQRPWPPSVQAIADECPNVRLDRTPTIARQPWYELATAVRQNLFHARFFDPEYADTPTLARRAATKAPGFARALLEGPLGRVQAGRRLLTSALRAVERSTPIPYMLVRYLEGRRPDVVVLTPLVVLKTVQLDLLRAARSLGIPTVFAVASWDHLSSKGLIHELPDRVVVWNQTQRQEAIDLHGIPVERIVVTGAQVFDQWFERRPSSSRKAFCARVGLRSDRPFVLYVGSALFEGSPSEEAFAARWIAAIRQRPSLGDCGVLVRPHFKRGGAWGTLAATALPNVVIWPPHGEVPVDAGSRESYFDSLAHAAAIVGLNTSALIEGAILGKPVLTILAPEFYGNQEGTLHFRYLTRGDRALLHAPRTLAEHAERLELVLTGRDPDLGRSEQFVGHFVRPGPPRVAATDHVVTAIETAQLAPGRTAYGWHIPAWLLKPLAAAAVRRINRIHAELRHIDEEKKRARLLKKAERAAAVRSVEQ
jgi:hypothetical protein